MRCNGVEHQAGIVEAIELKLDWLSGARIGFICADVGVRSLVMNNQAGSRDSKEVDSRPVVLIDDRDNPG